MEVLIKTIISFVENLSTIHTIFLLFVSLIIAFLLMYLIIAIETHVSHSPLLDFFYYQKYKVVFRQMDDNRIEIVKTVSARGEINAIEKAAKKLRLKNVILLQLRN